MGKKTAQKQPVSPSDVPLPESPVPGGMQVTSVPPDMLATLLQEMRQDRLEAQRRLDEERQEASRRFDQLLATLAPQVNVNNDSSHPNDTTSSPSSSSRPTLPKAAVQPPPVLQHDATLRQFREWKQLWDDYTVMVELDKLSQPKQLVQLRSALSSEMRRTLEVSLEVLPSSTLSVNDVIARLRDHVRSQKNEALRRLAFSQCKQAEGEKFNDFYIRLKQAAEEVDLCKGNDANCLETQIKHAVLIGVRDEEVKQRLLELKSDATLDQVITVCRSREAAEVTTQELRPSQPTARAVSAYKKQKHPNKHRNANGKKTEPQVNKNRSERQVNDRCGRCGYTHPKDKCPAIGEECRKCSKVGHFASCCMSKDTTNTTTGNRGNAMAVTGATQCNVRATTAQFPSIVGTPSPTIELRVCAGVKSGNVTCVPDTGADTTLMTRDLLKVLCMETSDLKRLENFGIGNPDGTSFASDMLGSVFIAMSYGNKTINGWVTVMESLPRSLLSYDHTKGLGMIPADYPRPIENGNVKHASVSSVTGAYRPISGEGIAADDTKVRAITEFPKPANITDVRSFMGLVNQLGDFSPHIAETAEPLRALMSPRRAFTWTPDHDVAFERVKKALSRPPVLAHFDPSLKVVLQTDASRLYGVGYALLQEHQDGTLRLIQCGSRFLADEESRYSTIELEMVAAVWGMVKCKYYLLGLPHFTIVIDHRPLVPILNTYTLDAIENPRLQRLKEKIAGYVYTSVWRKGRDHVLPDALSRAPVDQPTQEDIALSTETRTYVRGVVTQRAGDMTLDELRVDAREDPTYTKLLGYVTKGFPADRNDIEPELLPYWKQRDDMYHDGELVLIGPRVVVPSAQRRKVLARLHDAHCGIEATKRRARQTVWWPGINSDITSTVKACSPCQTLHPSQQQEPLVTEEAPELPFESVSADFFSTAGKSFLVYVDRLSGWPVVAQCGSDTTTTATIAFFRKFFRDLGVPVRLRSDGGPQFASREFADFLHRWGVRHEMSSPHYPQSNGHAEAAVKAVKYLIMKVAPTGTLNEDFDRGLLELRNTPRQDGRSPAQVLYGRPLRSLIPAHSASFASKWQAKTEVCERRAAARSMDVRLRYDSHAKPLPPLRLGDQVRIQDPTTKRWDKVATVMGVGKSRDYLVRTMSGRVLWRNRRFLLKIPAPTDIPKGEEPPDEGSPKLPATPGRRQRRPKDNVPLRRSQRIARRGGGGDVG